MALKTFTVTHAFAQLDPGGGPIRRVSWRVTTDRPVTVAAENTTVNYTDEDWRNGGDVTLVLPSSDNTEFAGIQYSVTFTVPGRTYGTVTFTAMPERFNLDGTVNPYRLADLITGGQFPAPTAPAPTDWATAAIFPAADYSWLEGE